MKRFMLEGPSGLVLAIALLVAVSAAAAWTPLGASPKPRYFGDEFAAEQRALQSRSSEEAPPTF